VKTSMEFTDPGAIPVTVTLTGSLKEFEELKGSLLESGVPYYQCRALIDQISEAARQLRACVIIAEPEKSEDQSA